MSPHPSPAARYRSAATALRGIRSRHGRTGATTSAIGRHEKAKADAVAAILTPDHLDPAARHLVGLLVEEEGLAERLRLAYRLGQDRPELQARVNDIRPELRTLL